MEKTGIRTELRIRGLSSLVFQVSLLHRLLKGKITPRTKQTTSRRTFLRFSVYTWREEICAVYLCARTHTYAPARVHARARLLFRLAICHIGETKRTISKYNTFFVAVTLILLYGRYYLPNSFSSCKELLDASSTR